MDQSIEIISDGCCAMCLKAAAKSGFFSSLKSGLGRMGSRVGRGTSASIDLGMNMPSELATYNDKAGPSKRMGPKQQMSLDATGRDASPRGRTSVPPRTLSLNAAPISVQLSLQQYQQQSFDKPEKQRFSAFGIGFMRSSKDKKKLNKADRSKKCNSSDSGIQLEISGDCNDAGSFIVDDDATSSHHHNHTAWFPGTSTTTTATSAPDQTSAFLTTNARTSYPDVPAGWSKCLSNEPQVSSTQPCDKQHAEQNQQQCNGIENESNNEPRRRLYSNHHGDGAGNRTRGPLHGAASASPETEPAGRDRRYEMTPIQDGRSRSRSRSRMLRGTAKSGNLRPEKLRRIKASIFSSAYHPLNRPSTLTRFHSERGIPTIRRTYSDLTHQHLDKLLYIDKRRATITSTRSYMSSPNTTSTPTKSGSPQPPIQSNNYVTRVAINVEECEDSVVHGQDNDTVQLRRGSCVAWADKSKRVGLGNALRRSLSQPLDVDRLKEALVYVRGKRALRLSNQRYSSGGTTSPTTTPTGTTSTSAASTSDESDTDDDDSVSYAERAKQSLRQRRVSLEELSNTSGEALRENGRLGAEEDQVVVLAEAVFDHVTIEREELAFKAGDVIEVQQTGDRNWWWGSTGNSSGWFPADRVRLRVSQEDTFEDCIAALQSGNVAPTPLRRRTSISLLSNDQVRTSVIRELVHTERDFVKVLLDVSEGYIAECRKRTEMFTQCQIDTIFMNIEKILRFQTAFLKDLEQCIDWDAPHKSCVGECFLKHREGFTIYSHYCNGHTLASATLQELCQLNNYSKFFEACRLMRGLIEIPLHGYLLAPVQRICKYPLQLAELLKYTRSCHRDHRHVQQALAAMRDVATLINDRKRRMESLEKLQLWQQRVEGWQGPDLIELSTQMICQGEAKRVSARRVTSSIVLFLFDSQVVYCKKDILNRNIYTYKGRIPMDTTEVIDLADGKDLHVHMNVRNAIKLYSCVSDWFLLFCLRTRADKQRWLDAFKAERQLVEADRAARLQVDFLPAARHLARVSVRCQAATDNLPRKPTDKGLTNGSYRTSRELTQHSNSNSLGRRMGTWFTFGGNTKRKRYRPKAAD